jgi:hypothetical protein
MNPIFVRTAAVSLVVVLFACSDSTAPKLVDKDSPRFTCVSEAPGIDLPSAFRAELDPRRLISRDEFPQNLPGGYAGFYTPLLGGVVIRFVDPVAGQSIQPVSKLLDDLGVPTASRNHVAYEHVRWNLVQLLDWFQYLEYGRTSPSVSGVVFADVDVSRNSITLGMVDEPARTEVINAYNAAAFPCNLIRTGIGYTPDVAR